MSEGARLLQLIPQFVVPDVVKTAEYYRDILGFEILGYFLDAMVRRDETEIHFGRSDNGEVFSNESLRKGLGADAYIVVSDLDGLYKELAKKGANIIQEPVKRVYGSIEFEILDCDGHKVVFAD